MAEWFEKFFDGLYAKVLPNLFSEEETLEDARAVKRVLGLRKGQEVLDIPCGMGRLTIPLAEMGLKMTGVDLTQSYIRRARRYARRDGLDARFICKDMRRIGFDAEFDAVLNWFGSFGYFSDFENQEFCRRAHRALRPGGRFLVETVNKSWLLAHFTPDSDRTVGEVRIVEHRTWDAQTRRILSTWTFYNKGETQRRRTSMRIYGAAEMESLLREAGFRNIALYGYRRSGRLSRHSERLIAVGQRPMEAVRVRGENT